MPEPSATIEAPSSPSVTSIITGTASPSGGSGAPEAAPAKSTPPAKAPAASKSAKTGKSAATKIGAAGSAPTSTPKAPPVDEPTPAPEAEQLAESITGDDKLPGTEPEAPEGEEETPAEEVDLSGLQAAIDKLAKRGAPLKMVERLLNSDPARLIELAGDYDDDAPAGDRSAPEPEARGTDAAPPAAAPQLDAAVKGIAEALGWSEQDVPKLKVFADAIQAPLRAGYQKLIGELKKQFAEVGNFMEAIQYDASIGRLGDQFPQMKTPAGAAKLKLKFNDLKTRGTYGSMDELVRSAAVSAFADEIAKAAATTAKAQAANRAKGTVGPRGTAGQLPTPRTPDEIADWNSKAIDRGMPREERQRMVNRFKEQAGIA